MASLAAKDAKPDKHHRETFAEDMERCTYLIRGKRQCLHRRTDGGTVCQLHEPSRLAKEQQLSVMKKRPRGEVLKEDGNEDDDDPLVPGKKRLSNVKRISSAQSRMFNGLCTPLEDHGVIGLPAPSSSSSSSSPSSSWNTHFDDLTLPTHVDVGCARGILVKELADRHRGRYNYVGIEVREKLVEEANKTEKNGNCCFLCANLMSSLHQQQLIQGVQEIVPRIERISILFPDPWIKTKHRTRRIIQVNVLQCLSQLLSPGGLLIIASDVEDIMIDAQEKLNACAHLFLPITADHPLVVESMQGDVCTSKSGIDDKGYIRFNPFQPLASEREQVCEMAWRRVYRLIYVRT